MKKASPLHASQSGTFLVGGDLPIYRLGFGAMRVTGKGVWGAPKDPKEAKAVLRRVIELGINFIDTADSYGPEISENLIAEILYPYPAGLIIATKGGLTRPAPGSWEPDGRPSYLTHCVEMSLKRLKLDCIDLYQLHSVDPNVPIEESLGALNEMQKQGKIKHIGLSNVSLLDIQRAKKIINIVSIQNQYNITNRRSESVLKYCEEHQLAFIPWFPLGSGNLTEANGERHRLAERKGVSVAQLALAWLLKHSPVMVPIPGTSSLKHLEENTASSSIELSEGEMELIESS